MITLKIETLVLYLVADEPGFPPLTTFSWEENVVPFLQQFQELVKEKSTQVPALNTVQITYDKPASLPWKENVALDDNWVLLKYSDNLWSLTDLDTQELFILRHKDQLLPPHFVSLFEASLYHQDKTGTLLQILRTVKRKTRQRMAAEAENVSSSSFDTFVNLLALLGTELPSTDKPTVLQPFSSSKSPIPD